MPQIVPSYKRLYTLVLNSRKEETPGVFIIPSHANAIFASANSRRRDETCDSRRDVYIYRDFILTTKAKQMHFLAWTHSWRPNWRDCPDTRQFEISETTFGNSGREDVQKVILYIAQKKKKKKLRETSGETRSKVDQRMRKSARLAATQDTVAATTMDESDASTTTRRAVWEYRELFLYITSAIR